MPKLVRFLGILTATVVWTWGAVDAAPIPSRATARVDPSGPTVSTADQPERRKVARLLASLGLDRSQVERRLSRLTSADVVQLSKYPGLLQTGGGQQDRSR